MSFLAYSAAPFDDSDINSTIGKRKQPVFRNRTLKRNDNANRVKSFLDKLDSSEQSDETSQMGDFKPPSYPVSIGAVKRMETDMNTQENDVDIPVSNSDFSLVDGDSPLILQQFHKKPPDNDISIKLDKMLYILEEQRDFKTATVTEDVILYSFLGIFVIFIVDSFTKVGQYKR
uniref:Uncharacterized protein n=1 Tax=viral metagenome TaxID=1070528 RepID=A0A6C0BT64_9ZZZZ